MSCSCTQRAADGARLADRASAAAPLLRLTFVVRDDSHPMACERCLEKHVGQAYIYAREYAEDASRLVERMLCVANLGCAGEHALALGRKELAGRVKAARLAFHARGDVAGIVAVFDELAGGAEGGRGRLEAIGRMAAAEEALRRAGGDEAADKVRELRRAWAEASSSGPSVG